MRALANVCIVLFFGVQTLVALWIFVRDPAAGPSDLSWDMFALKVSCTRVSAAARLPDGQRVKIPIDQEFPRWAHQRKLFYPDRFSQYGRFWCGLLRQRFGDPIDVRLSATCRYGADGPERTIGDMKQNVCLEER